MSKITDSCYGGVDAYCEDLDHKKKVQEKLEFKKHLYFLKQQGANIVYEDNERAFEKYIKKIEIIKGNEVLEVNPEDVDKVTVCDEPNTSLKIIVDIHKGAQKVYYGLPAIVRYSLREVKIPEKSEEE